MPMLAAMGLLSQTPAFIHYNPLRPHTNPYADIPDLHNAIIRANRGLHSSRMALSTLTLLSIFQSYLWLSGEEPSDQADGFRCTLTTARHIPEDGVGAGCPVTFAGLQ